MRIRSIFMVSLFLASSFFVSCHSNEIVGLIDCKIDITDKDLNKLNIQISGRYSTNRNELTKKEIQYIKNEKDVLKFISETVEDVTSSYSASEIYNYKRSEIEDEIIKTFEDSYNNAGLKVLDFYFVSVEMTDSLMNELIERQKEKMNN